MLTVTTLPRATPIYVLGDSHVFALSDRIYGTSPDELFVFRSLYCPGLRTRAFMQPDGELDARIREALQVGRVFVSTNGALMEAAYRTDNVHWHGIQYLDDRLDVEPALVISTGSIDIMEITVAMAEPDLALPEAILADPATPDVCRVTARGALPADEAVRRFAAPLEPLRTAMRTLREKGLTRIGVLGLPPMGLDDDACDAGYVSAGFALVERASNLGFRYKTILLMNAALRRLCGEEGVPFIDRWAAFTEGGLVRPGVLRDFIHLDTEAAGRVAAEVIQVLGLRPEPGTNGAQRAGDEMRRSYYEIFGGRKLEHAPLAAVYALAAAERDTRVLDVGLGRDELSYAFAAGGARLTAIDDSPDRIAAARTTLGDLPARIVDGDPTAFRDPAGYDVAIATTIIDRLSVDRRARLFDNLAAMLRPAGSLIVHTSVRLDDDQAPAVLRRQLGGAFDHVLLWVAAPDDARGSLARPFTAPELRAATDVFAIASNLPINAARALRRLASTSLSEDDVTVALSDLAAPSRVRAGDAFTIRVTLVNDGRATLRSFAPYPVRFAYAWDGASRDVGGRSRIEPASEPGSSRSYAVGVLAPAQRGRHVLRVSIVQESVREFGATAEIAIDVA